MTGGNKSVSARGIFLDGAGEDAVLLLHGLTGAPVEMHPLGGPTG